MNGLSELFRIHYEEVLQQIFEMTLPQYKFYNKLLDLAKED